jgi:undecaprenyl-diphosphatase
MNDIVKAAFLGVIEGLTEFLPVSSTAHLRIFQSMIGIDLENEYWKMFAVVIQLGAILAVLFYFRERIAGLIRTYRFQPRHPISVVMLAFLVTAVPAFLLSKVIGDNLESLRLIAISLIAGGVVMWVVDRKVSGGKTDGLEKVTPVQAAWIGAIQVLSAVFPGTSRSMSTIIGGQLAGLNRATALEFSFFVSIPTMIAATGYDLLKTVVLRPEGAATFQMGAHEWAVLATGFGVSFAVALAVIAWFMNWVRTKSFTVFAVYRIVFGAFVLWAASAGVV